MSKPMIAAISGGVVLFVLICYWFMPRFGSGQSGDSDYATVKRMQADAASYFTSQGAKLEEKHYPVGNAWAVNLSGLKITNKLLEELKDLGNISELDLSKTDVTDEQMGELSRQALTTFLLKLDLSHTSISDAGLDKLENLIVLGQLNLTGSRCTAAGIERFKKKHSSQPQVRNKHTKVTFN